MLDGVSCVFNDSDRVAIVGDNGAGKSTLLRFLVGNLVPDSGAVHIFGKIAYLNQDLLILDEPTNNLEIENIVLLVSYDEIFARNINVDSVVCIEKQSKTLKTGNL